MVFNLWYICTISIIIILVIVACCVVFFIFSIDRIPQFDLAANMFLKNKLTKNPKILSRIYHMFQIIVLIALPNKLSKQYDRLYLTINADTDLLNDDESQALKGMVTNLRVKFAQDVIHYQLTLSRRLFILATFNPTTKQLFVEDIQPMYEPGDSLYQIDKKMGMHNIVQAISMLSCIVTSAKPNVLWKVIPSNGLNPKFIYNYVIKQELIDHTNSITIPPTILEEGHGSESNTKRKDHLLN